MKSFIRQRLRESISASEAYHDEDAIKTVIKGKRDLGFITVKASPIGDKFWDIIKRSGLKTLHVPSNKYDAYIYFKEGAENKAKELYDIAEKYDGYLAYNATPEDTRKIGQLLGYKDSDITKYMLKNYVCGKMSVKTYEEGINILNNVIGTIDENPKDWAKIQKPLSMWRDITIQLRKELETGMTGDSEADESNTWWSAIQSTFCK